MDTGNILQSATVWFDLIWSKLFLQWGWVHRRSITMNVLPNIKQHIYVKLHTMGHAHWTPGHSDHPLEEEIHTVCSWITCYLEDSHTRVMVHVTINTHTHNYQPRSHAVCWTLFPRGETLTPVLAPAILLKLFLFFHTHAITSVYMYVSNHSWLKGQGKKEICQQKILGSPILYTYRHNILLHAMCTLYMQDWITGTHSRLLL